MNYLKRFAAMVIAVMIMATTVLGTLPAKAETETPGLNVVIVYDCSLSMHHMDFSYDQELMFLDAAVMMVNMCDARCSQVAVVPFTYQAIGKYNVRADHNRPGQTKEFNYRFYGEWTDISYANKRIALCNEMMKYFYYDEIVNGYTNQAEGMKAALELVKQVQGNGNKTMVLVLGDSDLNGNATNGSRLTDRAMIASEEDRAVSYADQIKALGGVIYCLDMGPVDKMNPLLQRIAGSAQDSDNVLYEYYRYYVEPVDLKGYFSEIFVDMVGAKQDTAVGKVGESDVTFEVQVLNDLVSEVNIILDKNRIKDINGVQVIDPSGNPVSEGKQLMQYATHSGGKSGYDYISLKIIDPQEGMWMIKVDCGESVRDDEEVTADLFYNYEVEVKSDGVNS